MTTLPFTPPERECGDCSMCCQGFLQADIHGYSMSPGVPCHFAGQTSCGGCTIYEDRPEVCQGYQCLWKISPQLPEWMKPNKADVLITSDQLEVNGKNQPFISVKEGFNHIRGDVLNYILRTCLAHDLNVTYEVHGAWYWQGDDDWVKEHMKLAGYRFGTDVTVKQPAQDT